MPGSGSDVTAAYHRSATCCLAGDMQDGVDVVPVKSRDEAAALCSWDGDELHAATSSLLAELRRDRQRAVGPRTDDQPAATPRNLLLGRQRSVAVSTPLRLRGFLDPLAHRTVLDDDVVIVLAVVDLDRTELDQLSFHLIALPLWVYPRWLLNIQKRTGSELAAQPTELVAGRVPRTPPYFRLACAPNSTSCGGPWSPLESTASVCHHPGCGFIG